jgi:hypothetical protein
VEQGEYQLFAKIFLYWMGVAPLIVMKNFYTPRVHSCIHVEVEGYGKEFPSAKIKKHIEGFYGRSATAMPSQSLVLTLLKFSPS